MKPIYLQLFFIFSIISCSFTTENDFTEKGNTIISKIKYKKNKSEIDTLWVSQNDTTVFRKKDVVIRRPCSKPEMQVRYELINPKVGSYYFIYNGQKQLLLEGKYTKEYTYDGTINKEGNFYNSKSYYYKNNGALKAIRYRQDGRDFKTESFDSKKRLTQILYSEMKSGDTEKIEIYKKGKLKETHIYTSFNKCITVKANN